MSEVQSGGHKWSELKEGRGETPRCVCAGRHRAAVRWMHVHGCARMLCAGAVWTRYVQGMRAQMSCVVAAVRSLERESTPLVATRRLGVASDRYVLREERKES